MNLRAVAVGGLLSVILAATLGAAAPDAGLPSLETVKWAGPSVSVESLRGKTAVVLVYATWCPKCNKWSGEFFAQLKEAVKDKPVVVLAINADKKPGGVKQYLTQRGFFAPNILHGYDPSMTERLGFRSNLFQFVLVRPDGGFGGKGQAGSFIAGNDKKQFVLPAKLAQSNDLGRFELLKPEMSDALKQILWPLEIGQLSDNPLGQSRKRLSEADRKELDVALEKYLAAKLRRIAELAKGAPEEQFEAFDQATRIAALFKNTQQSKEARALVGTLSRDKNFRRELAAKRAYEKTLKMAVAQPNRRGLLLKNFIKRFHGTHYAKLAEKEKGKKGSILRF